MPLTKKGSNTTRNNMLKRVKVKIRTKIHNFKLKIRQKISGKHIFADFVLIGIILVAFEISLIVTDIRLPVFNPPDKENTLRLSSGGYINGQSPNNPSSSPDLTFLISIKYSGILVINEKATISVVCYINTPQAQWIKYARVKFVDAFSYPPTNDSYGFPEIGTVLLKSDANGKLVGKSENVYWALSGDYPAELDYYNDTAYGSSTTPTSLVHVEPETTLLTEQFNRVDIGISLALIYFAFIEGFKTYIEYRNK